MGKVQEIQKEHLQEVQITAVASIWLQTFGKSIDYVYAIGHNNQGYFVAAGGGDGWVLVGAHLDTEVKAEEHMRQMVREMGGMLYKAADRVHTILHSSTLEKPWKWFGD